MFQPSGIMSRTSPHAVEDTVTRILDLLRTKGVTVFAVVDHSGEAAKVGLTMRPTQLVIFGSPKAGTPLMVAAPSLALDLPLKLLVAEVEDGSVTISLNTSAYLAERHGLAAETAHALDVVAAVAEAAAS
jgi:uncharacterized protein (DUF302 family)